MSESVSVRFSVFEVDLRSRELRKQGVRLKLQEQPFQVLEALLERPGELVTREELQRKIWRGETTVDFDQSLNRAVNKLRDALGDGAGSPRFIETLPRKGYRFIGSLESPRPVDQRAPEAVKPRHRIAWTSIGLLVAIGIWIWLARNRGASPAARVVPLTAFTGTESHVTFSPDGKQVAFAWDGEKQDNVDIYAKVIGEPGAVRLTTDPGLDAYPAWSPDGQHIAFASDRGNGGVYLTSALGGQERKVADLLTNSRPAWSPDGKFVLVSKQHRDWNPQAGDGALFLVPIENMGEPRAILTPARGSWYKDPAYAPGGGSLAFALCSGASTGANCRLQVVGVSKGWIPSGEVQRTTELSLKVLGLTWTADGSGLIYSSQTGNELGLWRVGVKDGKSERVELAGSGTAYPAIDLKSGRLAYSRRSADDDIWRLERGGQPSPLLTSSRLDTSPQFSPDGRHIAFSSGREGEGTEIWVANADGSGARQITRMEKFSGTPRWSPDGRWIAFDSRISGWDIWVVEAGGGSPRQLTHGPSDNVIPSWSRDGKSIYFASNRTSRFEIWRKPAQAGGEEQVTHNGGYVAFESTDAKTLYYTLTNSGDEGLYAKGLPDQPERQLLKEKVAKRGLVVTGEGIYYLSSRAGRPLLEGTWVAPFETPMEPYEVRFFRFANGEIQVISKLQGPFHLGLTCSPDQKTFLFAKIIDWGADLMLIQNFR